MGVYKPRSLATSGIYTKKDLENPRDRIMFPVERPSLLNEVAREMHGQVTSHEGALMKLLTEDTMEKIVESTGAKLWEKFMTFGTASAGIIAIFLIIQIIKMVIEIIINGFLLHRIYGWSVHMMGVIWGSITQCLLQMGNKAKIPAPNKRRQTHGDVEFGFTEDAEQQLPIAAEHLADIAVNVEPLDVIQHSQQ